MDKEHKTRILAALENWRDTAADDEDQAEVVETTKTIRAVQDEL